jgi:hypothetical protein
MKIILYEPDLRENGLFRFLYHALIECAKASLTSEPRPLPRMTQPREHNSSWASFDGRLALFDFSDHAFLYDLPALDRCDIYFKTNLNWPITELVLARAGRPELRHRILPFFSFSPHIEELQSFARARSKGLRGRLYRAAARCLGVTYDICHIAGVYNNPVIENHSKLLDADSPPDPDFYHVWVRYHSQQALRSAGIRGYYRLTAKDERLIDGRLVFPRLRLERFASSILRSRISVVNTLPHALLPWKATEALALGRPLVLECEPLMEMWKPLGLQKDVHYLEMFPGCGHFDVSGGLDDRRSYRTFPRISAGEFRERAEWLREVLADRARMEEMTQAAQEYSDRVLQKQNLAESTMMEVAKRIR